MKSFLAGLGVALAAAMIWQKRAEVRQQPGHSPAGDRQGEPRGGLGVVRQRSRPESRVHSEPAVAPRPETPRRVVVAGGAGESGRGAVEAIAGSAEGMLNSATRQQLLSVYGIGPVLADRIIQNRPYKTAYEVVEKGIIPETIFVQLRKQLLQQHEA